MRHPRLVTALVLAAGAMAWWVLHAGGAPVPGSAWAVQVSSFLLAPDRTHGDGTAALVLLAGGAAAVAVGVPRLAVYTLAGAGWGLGPGFALAHAASTVGALLDYGAGRMLGRRKDHDLFLPGLGRTWVGVFIARQLPLPGTAVSVVLGARRVPLRAFVPGTVLGFVPQGAAAALAGSGWQAHALVPAALRVGGAALALAALALVTRGLAQHLRASAHAPPLVPGSAAT